MRNRQTYNQLNPHLMRICYVHCVPGKVSGPQPENSLLTEPTLNENLLYALCARFCARWCKHIDEKDMSREGSAVWVTNLELEGKGVVGRLPGGSDF